MQRQRQCTSFPAANRLLYEAVNAVPSGYCYYFFLSACIVYHRIIHMISDDDYDFTNG